MHGHLGVDPGLHGAWALLDGRGLLLVAGYFPLGADGEIEVVKLADTWRDLAPVAATVELVGQITRIRCLRGNHDPEASVALQIALAAFYHANPRVTVELDPADMFFHPFGATLIGACHGDRMKPDRMAMSMAMLRPLDWGASRFRWFLFGHIHHESVKEVGNVRCESFQTICAKDAYAASHGYLAGQSLNSVTLHRERGEIGRHRGNVLPMH